MNFLLRFALVICLAASVTGFASPTLADKTLRPWIEVSGSGKAVGRPDTAILSLTVQGTAKTARLALDENNKVMTAVLAGLGLAGIGNSDLQTSGFSMQPRYEHPGPRKDGRRPAAVLTGYMVSNQLVVKVRKIDRVGEILDLTVSLGVNKIGNISFWLGTPANFWNGRARRL